MADTNWLDSFRQHYDGLVDEKTKRKVLEGWEKVGEFSNEELSHWLKGVIERLDAMVDEPTRKKLMERCGYECAEMHNVVKSAVDRRKQFASLDEYLEAEQREPKTASRIERDGQILYAYYKPGDIGKRCFCSLWHGLQDDETVSLTWCNCSRSLMESIWSAVLERQAKVELLESCIAGAEECKFAVYL
ncbi:hypothetical protein FJZ31_28145 [Candidatus Poribacteria bacterium]|nr:hypothetical protein [Candidatus Poribacteria bacterium]